jgi:hypothetical protein
MSYVIEFKPLKLQKYIGNHKGNSVQLPYACPREFGISAG